jgi:ribosomal protein S18 acetylase RimI-like enzyme
MGVDWGGGAVTEQPSIVVPMREDQMEPAAAILARAFQDDPLFVAMFPVAAERTRVMPAIGSWNLRHALLFGTALVAGNEPTGVAILYRGDESVFTEAHLAASLGALPEQLGADVWDRYERMQETWTIPEERLAAAVPEPHWYLDMVGVDPARQGAGVGGALLQAIHERADRDGCPIALFTVQPRNVSFYERHGYELVAEGTEPIAGLSYWCFRRAP